MKRILFIILLLIIPLKVMAYSEYIIPGGETLGIKINSKGILVVGFYKVNNRYINQDLQAGDRIISVNNKNVNSVSDLTAAIASASDKSKVDIVYLRNNKKYNGLLVTENIGNSYKTGIYVKSEVIGIGTLTYIDPDTKVYGVLGHVINDSKTNTKIEVKDGNTYKAIVTDFVRSINGKPGSKNANIDRSFTFGSIKKNTNYGVFGLVENDYKNKLMKVGNLSEAKTGEAIILTTNESNKVEEYTINIMAVNENSKEKNFYFEVTDKRLLEMSGGIVQGMSGSPIIQNDKIIGAVTRVIVDDVTKGYGISIITMLEEGDKLKD